MMNDPSVNFVSVEEGIARCAEDELIVVDLPHRTVGDLLRDGGSLDAARDAPVRCRLPFDQNTTLHPPISRPLTVWGAGLNYRAKAALTGRAVPDEPILFLKPAAALAAPGARLDVPAVGRMRLDYEGEVAIVVGRRLSTARESEVWPSIAAITAANDITARDLLSATANPTLAKSFAGCSPLGASVLAVEALTDPDDIGLATSVNGEPRQHGRTGDLIFSVPELLARISRYATLEPGDVVLTGTPPGTGQDLGRFLEAGDRIEVTVEGVVPLVNTIEFPGGQENVAP